MTLGRVVLEEGWRLEKEVERGSESVGSELGKDPNVDKDEVECDSLNEGKEEVFIETLEWGVV
ncbi:hypothetical protein HMI55_004131 [Coelomomyces lativittatus]|nr:hypothetical protein HMI55_004131 [Coelomomyces lativittatus]